MTGTERSSITRGEAEGREGTGPPAERTFVWLGKYRLPSKDYEHPPTPSETVVQLAATHHMLQLLPTDDVLVPLLDLFRVSHDNQ